MLRRVCIGSAWCVRVQHVSTFVYFEVLFFCLCALCTVDALCVCVCECVCVRVCVRAVCICVCIYIYIGVLFQGHGVYVLFLLIYLFVPGDAHEQQQRTHQVEGGTA